MKGNTGRIININLTTGDINVETLPEAYYTQYIGGSGLAAKLFIERGDLNAEPLSPEAMLIFANGPFAGVRLPGASRNAVGGRSPLTGNWGDGSCGGYFAPELRFAGYDGIILTGRAATPTLLFIEDDKIQLLDASDYWGKGIFTTHHDIRNKFGKDFRTVLIGQAGENLVRYAAIINDEHHAFGRAGFGAIMGSKYLKGIIVKGTKKTLDVAEPERYETFRKELLKRSKESPVNEPIHEHGSALSLQTSVLIGDAPIKNWQSNSNDPMGAALDGPVLTATYLKKRGACQFCSIACKRVVEIPEGPFAIPEGPGPEYETIISFGTLLNSANLAATCKAGRLCNDLGMDTISAGATVAWAMEAFERGDLRPKDMGRRLEWGDMEAVMDLLDKIAHRQGPLGNLLADGAVQAATKVGKGAIDYTCHSKGLEAPMHDPRGCGHGMALTYAISPRGACHVGSTMHFIEMGIRYPELGWAPTDMERLSGKYRAEADTYSQALGCMKNSACWCMFADLSMTLFDYVTLFNYVAGYNWDIDAMMKSAKRVFYLKRLINYRFGRRAVDDALTPRMLQPAVDGLPAGIHMELSEMISEFYDRMGMDHEAGIPTQEIIAAFNLTREAQRAGIAA